MVGVSSIREALAIALEAQPGLTARDLTKHVRRMGLSADKSTVNSVLYSNRSSFKSDGATPPKWSLASDVSDDEVRPWPFGLCGVALTNWKVFESADVEISPITLIFGENSAGKSSLIQALLLLRQSWGSGSLHFEGQTSFGWFNQVVHRHDEEREISVRASWLDPDDREGLWQLTVVSLPGTAGGAGNDWHPIAVIVCQSADRLVFLARRDVEGSSWVVATARLDKVDISDEIAGLVSAIPSAIRGEAVGETSAYRLAIAGSDDYGFPDLSTVEPMPESQASLDGVEVASRVISDAGDVLDALVYVGPSRRVPGRGTDLAWAREHAEYLALLFEDQHGGSGELLDDLNLWLLRFEIPYTVSVEHYGDDSFALKLTHLGDEGEHVDLPDVGFGVSQLLPVITQLVANREKTILIEEPEAHVHPRLQAVLGDLFVYSAQERHNVIVAETHSEPILLRLQRRVAEDRIDQDEVAVHHIVRAGNLSEVESVPLLSNGQLDYEWPGGFFDNRMEDLLAILDPQVEG